MKLRVLVSTHSTVTASTFMVPIRSVLLVTTRPLAGEGLISRATAMPRRAAAAPKARRERECHARVGVRAVGAVFDRRFVSGVLERIHEALQHPPHHGFQPLAARPAPRLAFVLDGLHGSLQLRGALLVA